MPLLWLLINLVHPCLKKNHNFLTVVYVCICECVLHSYSTLLTKVDSLLSEADIPSMPQYSPLWAHWAKLRTEAAY